MKKSSLNASNEIWEISVEHGAMKKGYIRVDKNSKKKWLRGGDYEDGAKEEEEEYEEE